jgi:hypothetical protein
MGYFNFHNLHFTTNYGVVDGVLKLPLIKKFCKGRLMGGQYME